MDDVPDITVELDSRRSIIPESTFAGVLTGVCFVLVVEADLTSTAAIGFPHVFEGSAPGTEWGFQVLFAMVFGVLFGLLANNRGFWRYGRGFLGPAVGAVFGVLLWLGADVLFWPLWQWSLGTPFGTPPPELLAVTSYLVYGALVGVFTNLLLLIRA